MIQEQGAGVSTAPVIGNQDDPEYREFLQRVQQRLMGNADRPLFLVDAPALWEAYLNGFSDGVDRQHHTCNSCRKFIEHFGGLAVVNDAGRVESAIWDESDAPERYKKSIAALAKIVKKSKITGVFLSSEKLWGLPETGPWCHFAITPPADLVYKSLVLSAHQRAAQKLEDLKTVQRALADFTAAHVETALSLLKSDALYRSEKVLGQAEWLHDLYSEKKRGNLLWVEVAKAPDGFCHPRSSMIGTLLEDIAAGMDFGDVSRRFAAKMSPILYQRPQAAPSAGAIAAAEKIVDQLSATGSLRRRYAKVEDLQTIWRPRAADKATGSGLFGHLQAKGTSPTPAMDVPAQNITWEKFRRTVLDSATRIEILTPQIGSYSALITAVDPQSPPIIQWDREERRNPVSWYLWTGGSTATSFCLKPGMYCPVEAVTLKPSMWNGGYEHQGTGAIFVIEGAKETRSGAGAALFPEILRAEFHSIRSVIESYSRSASIEGFGSPHAAGLMFDKGPPVTVRVWTERLCSGYRIDRWD